jgi:hypothetical protein
MRTLLLAAAALVLAGVALAQQPTAPHGEHAMPPPGSQAPPAAGGLSRAPATAAYEAAAVRMHKDMSIPYTGDADVDFLRSMIPHHRGAVEMAGIVLQHGKDAQVRKLAEAVVTLQGREIAEMEGHLRRLGH